MYRADLSWFACQVMSRHLMAKGSVRANAEGGKRRYGLTSTGLDVLGRFLKATEEVRT
ncbi:MAG: hypothetical protein JRN28_00655 [Nitrososphaerota archaeon]|nr:hypothetical protein [Nitrososphaerota archaeon]